jgi:hypothetical protein
MFLRKTQRKKDGKAHGYWRVMETQWVARVRVVQRHLLYLGEINAPRAAACRRAVVVVGGDTGQSQTLSLFPEDRCDAAAPDASVMQLRLSQMRLFRPRQFGTCSLAGLLWRELELHPSWAGRLAPSRAETGRSGTRFCKRWSHIGGLRRAESGDCTAHGLAKLPWQISGGLRRRGRSAQAESVSRSSGAMLDPLSFYTSRET